MRTLTFRTVLQALILPMIAGSALNAAPAPDAFSSQGYEAAELEVVEFHPGHGVGGPVYTGPGFTASIGGGSPLPFPASGVRLLAWITVPTFNSTFNSANSCWGYTSPSGREYAIIGLSGGTGFVEITDPGDPQIISVQNGPESLWRDMKTFGNYSYSVSEGGSGIQVFNLANIDAGVVTFVRSVTTGGGTATHTMFVNEQSGFLYRCGGQGGTNYGIRVYDLNTDPSNPVFVGQWNNRYVHEVQVVNWTTPPFAGREIAFCFANDISNGGNPRINILDVTNKASITQISQIGYSNSAFSHQGWLSPDRRFVYHNDELDEATFNVFNRTRIFDVQNLAAPTLVGSFSNGLTNIDHNLYTKGNLIFQSNYRAGLRVVDATVPTAPVEIGFFDTWPEDDMPEFNGLWNNYPFFNSGTIIGSDIEKGLFVWRMGLPELVFTLVDPAPSMIPAEGASLRIRITPAEGQSVQPGSPKVRVQFTGNPNPQEIPLVSLGGDLYRADLPPGVCGGEINYFYSARTAQGLTAREPSTAPSSAFRATIGTSQNLAFEDLMETDTGWTVGAPTDTASAAGVWIRADPVGTAAQPEDDASTTGTQCWITGNGIPGGSVGAADVDGGATTLTSPLLNAVSQAGVPVISYARWYSNDRGASPNEDTMPVEISNDGGESWVLLESVNENALVWVKRVFRVSDFVTPTDRIRVRFVARDLGSGSVVEAGVDDLRISFVQCVAPPAPCPGDADSDRDRDFSDITSILTNFGATYTPTGPGDSDQNGVVNFSDITSTLTFFGVPCP